MDERQRRARAEWRKYLPLVIAASVGFSFLSLMSPALGLFMEPLQKEFHWSRSMLSSGMIVGALLSLFLAPLFGALIDRFGSRRIAIPGIAATAVVIAGFSLLNGSTPLWFAFWIAFGLASLAIHATTWTTAVASVFVSGRGLALGVTLSGSAAALAIVPPLTNWLIDAYGWRGAFLWLGLGWGAVALVLSWMFLVDARTGHEDASPSAVDKVRLDGLTIGAAWRSVALWKVALATLLILTVTVGVSVHQVPILISAGVSRTNAAWLASLGGLAGIVGKIVTGLLLDRFHARWIGGLTLASTAIAYPLLLEPFRTPLLITVAIMINGYAAGTKMQLCSYLTAQYGGMRHYGSIFGFMGSMIALAGGLGPILAGQSFDRSGSYALFLTVGAIISVVSGLLVLSLGAYPRWKALAGH